MIFISYRNFGEQVFASLPDTRSSLSNSREMVEVPYTRFGSYGGYGDPRKPAKDTLSLEVADVKVVGYYPIRSGAWSSSHDDNRPSLTKLVDWYLTHGVTTPFPQWLSENPQIGGTNRGRPVVFGLFRTWDGKMVVLFSEGNRIKVIEIAESCFIQEHHVTSVEEAMRLREADLQRRLDDVRSEHTKLREQPYDYPELVSRSGLGAFAKCR